MESVYYENQDKGFWECTCDSWGRSYLPYLTLWASSYLLHILAHHHSMWDPTGTWESQSQPARTQGSTGRWQQCHGWGQGGKCSSSRWWSQAARNRCRSSVPLLVLHCVGRRGEDQNGKCNNDRLSHLLILTLWRKTFVLGTQKILNYATFSCEVNYMGSKL